MEPLQHVQNAAARLVLGLSRFDHVTPSIIQLHWLPVYYRIKVKLCCLIHAIRYDRSPKYLTDIVQPANITRQTVEKTSFQLQFNNGLLSASATASH